MTVAGLHLIMLKKIPFYIITGFLGSGKTTFVQRIIDAQDGSKKLAIIQNEFAPANIDGQELKRTTSKDFDLLEVNNGSVFCVCLLSGFIKSLQIFVDTCYPDIIFMEASGLSDTVGIGEILQSNRLSDKLYYAGSICIVDAVNILKTGKLIQRMQHQIAFADTVIINKIDLVDNVDEIQDIVNNLNPLGKKYTASFCNLDVLQVIQSIESSLKSVHEKPQNNRPDINSCVLKSSRPIKPGDLDRFIDQLTMRSYRSKGYVITDNGKSYAIQTVFDQSQKEELQIAVNSTEIITMGYDITIRELKKLYQSCLAT